jgi:hypothetical protein
MDEKGILCFCAFLYISLIMIIIINTIMVWPAQELSAMLVSSAAISFKYFTSSDVM